MLSTLHRLDRENSTPEAEKGAPKLSAFSTHDGWMRGLGYLLLGIVIPRSALLFDKVAWDDSDYWLGSAWFLLTAAAIWECNRWLAAQLRAQLDWLRQPFWKLAILLAANFACTIPLTLAAVRLWLWHIHSPFPALDWLATTRVIATDNAVTVLFLLHAYETLSLIRERHGDRARLQHLELQAMQGQLAPHFLFNCLNTLAALIERDPAAAAEFNAHLADVARYLVAKKHADLVSLSDEMGFLRSYVHLMELRFPRSLTIRLPVVGDHDSRRVPPASLQSLIENGIKHNRLSEAEPLVIDLSIEGDTVVVRNPLRPKSPLPSGSGTGLANLRERVAMLTPGRLEVRCDAAEFRVRLPLTQA